MKRLASRFSLACVARPSVWRSLLAVAVVASAGCASSDHDSTDTSASALDPISNLPRAIECDDENGCPIFHTHDLHAAWESMPQRVPNGTRLGVYLWQDRTIAVVSYPMAAAPHDVQVVDVRGTGPNSPWRIVAGPPSYGALPTNVELPERVFCAERGGCEVFFTDDFARGAYAPWAVGTLPTRVPCGGIARVYVKNSLASVAAISLPLIGNSDRGTERYGMVKMVSLRGWSASTPTGCLRRHR